MYKDILDRIDNLNLAVLAYNNEALFKEAYYTYFTIDNRCELNNYLKRINNYLTKYNISYDTFLEYVKTYAILFLDINSEIIKNRIIAVSSLSKKQSERKNNALFAIISMINNSNDDEIEQLVLANHIYLDKIDYLFMKGYFDKNFYDLVTSKVSKAIERLNKKYKYLHFSAFLSNLEKENDDEILEEMVKNNKFHAHYVRSFISSYRNNLKDEEKEQLEDSIKNKIDESKKRIKQKKDKKRLLELKEKVTTIDFSVFLDDKIKSIDDFCALMNISKDCYYEYLNIIKCLDNSLYLAIKEKNNKNRIRTNDEVLEVDKVVDIANQIKNGCLDVNGNTRNFELLDYFLQAKLGPGKFIDIYRKSEESDEDVVMALRAFFDNNDFFESNNNLLSINTELSSTTILLVEGSPYEVTREEKEEVINYLKEQEIPINIKIYKQALKRYLNGTLIQENIQNTFGRG